MILHRSAHRRPYGFLPGLDRRYPIFVEPLGHAIGGREQIAKPFFFSAIDERLIVSLLLGRFSPYPETTGRSVSASSHHRSEARLTPEPLIVWIDTGIIQRLIHSFYRLASSDLETSK